jgi:hypothetical protein
MFKGGIIGRKWPVLGNILVSDDFCFPTSHSDNHGSL